MKSSYLTIACRRLLVSTIFFSNMFFKAEAQNSSIVIGLRFNDKSVTKVSVNVFPPGRSVNLSEVAVNEKLASGTKLIIPTGTIIVLQSPGGRQVVKSTIAGKSIEYKVDINALGENHVVKGLGAQIENSVKKTLGYNYRNTNDRGTTAASKGTEFTFTDLSDSKTEKASIVTSEGSIKIIDQVPCYVNGEPVKNNRKGDQTTKAVSQTQSAGDKVFTSSNQPIDYGSYENALIYIKMKLLPR